jgi:predicted dehydrogenase
VIRIALIGCGAIADAFHLPALLSGSMGDASLVLVDPDPARSSVLARKYAVSDVATDHREVIGRVDAAIVASPHGTHVPIGLDLVAAGIPILVEKPLGTSTDEIRALRDLSAQRSVPVAVNHTRRFMPATQEIGRLVQAGALGQVTRVDAAEGDQFSWPAATASMFGLRSGGRGILLDIGVHVLDLMTWWFGPDLAIDDYRDDSFGGSEATSQVDLSAGPLRVAIRLSWLAKQRNAYRIEGSDATLEWGIYDLDLLTITSRPSGRRSSVDVRGGARTPSEVATQVHADFAQAVSAGRRPMVTPDDCLASMRIIEDCYGRRQRFGMPWHAPQGGFEHVI